MPPPLDVDKDQVAMLVRDVGPREAARRCNLKETTVLQWTSRYGWLDHLKESAPEPPKSMQKQAVIGVIKPVDAQAITQREDSKAIRTAVLKGGRKVTEHWAKTAQATPELALAQAADLSAIVKSAALAGNWAGDSSGSVRIAIHAQQMAIGVGQVHSEQEPDSQ